LGMRDIAKRYGLQPVFVTATLPGEWHLHPKSGVAGDPRHSPADGSDKINGMWHNAICMFRKGGGDLIGIRVAEPHEDGTIHFHIVAWTDPAQIGEFSRCLGRHFPAATEEERAARVTGDYSLGPALVIRGWEQRKDDDPRGAADAATYALGYVLDILEGKDESAEAETSKSRDDCLCKKKGKTKNADRVRAWARQIGSRRLGLLGFAPGTIGRWEKIYAAMRMADREGRRIEEPRARATAHAFRTKQWGRALLLLGALRGSKPRFMACREARQNKWGETVKVTTAFYHSGTGEISALSRPHQWQIEKVSQSNPLNN
jgi:hypothetical protein